MKLFDVNILIYAHRKDQPEHAFYNDYLQRQIEHSDAFAMSPLVAGAFVRIVTNPRFPNGPTPLPQALAVIDSLVSLKHCHLLRSGQRHWEILSSLCRQTQAKGKLVADAQHAAVAIENSCQWITRDGDFECFQRLGLQLELIMPN